VPRTKSRYVLFAVWLTVTGAALLRLTISHATALPPGIPTGHLAGTGSWRAIHVLSPECGCSRRIAAYLSRRRALPELHETVWMLDAEMPASRELRAMGFHTGIVEANRYRGAGVPWLLFVAPDGRIAYSGGYQRPLEGRPDLYQDTKIWAALRTGTVVPPLPIFGCSTQKRLG